MSTWLLFTWFGVVALAERAPGLRGSGTKGRRPYLGTDIVFLVTGALGLGLLMRWGIDRLVGGSAPASAALAGMSAVLVGVAGLVLYDLLAYATHWMLHRHPLLWRLHAVHHSSRRLDWLATYRAHVLEHALRHLMSTGVLIAIGFPLTLVAGVAAVYAGVAALNHADLRLPLRGLETVFITPRLHRLHHVVATSESNLGTIFSIWDRLRGTLVTDAAAASEPLGVPGRVDDYPQTWGRLLVEPFRGTRPAVPIVETV